MRLWKSFLVLTSLCALLAVPAVAGAAEKKTLMWGATSASSGYYPMSVAMAEVVNREVPSIAVTVVETGATNDNFRRMEKGELSFGQGGATDVYMANHGAGVWKGRDMKRQRVMLSSHPQVYVFAVTEESGITKLSDLNDKPYTPGLKGSITEMLAYAAFDSLGIKPKLIPSSTGEAVDAMKDRRIVGFTKATSVNAPDSSLQDVATARKVRILSFTPEEQKKFKAVLPMFGFFDVDNTLYGHEGKSQTIGGHFGMAVDTELDADTVYQIVKAICEHSEEIGKTYAGVRGFDLAKLTSEANAWLHPGTIRYLKEKGFKLDKGQLPPEYKE
ncbi:putative trap transporter solute receptor, taxi family [uncultured delta proteobacterium]|uniref:Putative trap transporter solute receptor, taxi family n=1 Tax=uncultured delta proteobacterium TaxID=34034 RepID=A0A212KES6_9DELT|nr:putative trap transporter solute receptor, taxi family [uncultured delta proteobacterium]